MALEKVQHIKTGTVKDADSNVAKQLIESGEYKAYVEEAEGKKKSEGGKKSEDKGGADAGKSGTGTSGESTGA